MANSGREGTGGSQTNQDQFKAGGGGNGPAPQANQQGCSKVADNKKK